MPARVDSTSDILFKVFCLEGVCVQKEDHPVFCHSVASPSTALKNRCIEIYLNKCEAIFVHEIIFHSQNVVNPSTTMFITSVYLKEAMTSKLGKQLALSLAFKTNS